jgi:hypothetical protein
MLNFPILFEFYFHGTFIVSGHIPVIMYCLLYDNFGLLHMDLRKVKELHVSQRKMGYR